VIKKLSFLLIFILISLLIHSASIYALPSCHIIFDAGSSGTRLYVYELQDKQWAAHAGPKAGALADPVRGELSQDWLSKTGAVVKNIVKSLEDIKAAGSNNQGKWDAFNWSTKCDLKSANVFATAGMRLAEQDNSNESFQLWKMLQESLENVLPKNVSISTRTITGFEEGLYAWLAVREEQNQMNYFGIVEMGGASSQVTFRCDSCGGSKPIIIEKESIPLYSYSFLGLGQTEALKNLGRSAACAYGAGLNNSKWTYQTCAKTLKIKTAKGIRDPYNYGPNGKGIHTDIPVSQANAWGWALTGAFQYMKDGDIENSCKTKNTAFEPETSCFRAVYLRKYLKVLGVAPNSPKSEASWTLGSVICEKNDCLQKSKSLLKCYWMNGDCLIRP